jgi:hypothetical protein
MRVCTTLAVLSLALTLASPQPGAAQTSTTVVSSSSCLSDWWCGRQRPPLGFYVRSVELGGRYVTLEDGSVWEVEISDRATAASWLADDFVGVRWIAAPRGDYEFLLTRTGTTLEQRAAARLAGRRAADYQTAPPAEPE